MEQMPVNTKESIEEKVPLKVNSEGKEYEKEVGGVYYGGDYLPQPPEEIYIEVTP